MNGVISNGRAPRIFSMVGIVNSVNCTWQLAHHEITPVLPSASRSSEFGRTARTLHVAGTQLHDAAAMRRAAHDFVGDAERIHDVERGSAICGVLSTLQPV